MAGTSSDIIPADEILNAAKFTDSNTPITDQLYVVWTKAVQLETDEAILGKYVAAQITVLIQISNSGKAIISRVEETKININPQFEEWLEKVYTTISLADDLLDECEYHKHHQSALSSRLSRTPNKMSMFKAHRNLFELIQSWRSNNIAQRFKRVNADLKTLLDKGGTLSISESERAAGERSARNQGKIDASEIESNAIHENVVNKIVVELLYSDNVDFLSYISFVGWGNSGKTALAKKMYKSAEVVFHFDERMWVQVPQGNLDIDAIVKGMLTTLTRDPVHDGSTKKAIYESLHKRLKGRRYLLVLAGMSEVNSTDLRLRQLIKLLLNLGGSRGCKILTTTGKIEPAESSLVYFTHEMAVPSLGYSSTLFNMISSAGHEGGRTAMESEILDICPGDSWSVKILAGLKNRFANQSRWFMLEERIRSFTDDAPFGPLDNAKLCFDYMSSLLLKRCLQYCSVFPEGYLIEKEELIQLWMAQGYLNLPTSTILNPEIEPLGLLYYEILIKCCFLQVSEDDDFEGDTCKMPASLPSVVVSEDSRDCCKTLRDEVSLKDVQLSWKSIHLSVINCKGKFSKAAMESFSKLRTLRLENTSGLLKDFLECAPQGLRVLIVVESLIVEGQDPMKELPYSISKLICLKYLDISRTRIEKLPDSISDLHNLQTLKLYNLEDVPRNFEDLVSLRHLYIQKKLTSLKHFPEKFKKLVKRWHSKASFKVFLGEYGLIDSLERVEIPTTCSSICIHGLENAMPRMVKTLEDGDGDEDEYKDEDETAGMVKKYGIESLKLHWSASRANTYYEEDSILENLEPDHRVKNLAIENFKGTSFPSWMLASSRFLQHLVKLDLKNCSWCEVLPPLGHLPCLTILKVVGMDNVSCISGEFYGPESGDRNVFPKLKVFILSRMPKLAEWCGLATPSLMSVFPSLVRLEVEQCPQLDVIPNIVLCSETKCLRKLRIAHCERLTAVPAGLRELEFLVDLELFGLPLLSNFSVEAAKHLKRLTIGCFSEDFEMAPRSVVRFSTLTNLTIWGFGEEEFPDWITGLPSLQILKLELWSGLQHLPSVISMNQLTSLKEFNISNCPLLEDGCITGGRPEWKKVSHIQTIVVNDDVLPVRQQTRRM